MAGENSEIARLETATTLGLSYLRTMVTLNGGAILALLTYLGNANTQGMVYIPLQSIKCSMGAFLAAICLMMLGMIVSYSFTANDPNSAYSRFWNNWIVPVNSVVGLLSLALFVTGVCFVLAGAE